jgi:toxin CcdB
MAQFHVHENGNPDSRSAYPLLMDLQSPLLEGLETRIVAPLKALSSYQGRPLDKAMPLVRMGDVDWVILLPSSRQCGNHSWEGMWPI